MKRNVRRALSALLSVVMLLSLLVVPAGAAGEEAKPTVWLVGDSTVSAFNDNYYYPRYGYGTQIGNYLDGTYSVQNLAVSGTSSLSFEGHANYATLFGASGIKAGDTLIIGFGHNDEKNEVERYTDPAGDYKTAGSFANSLYERYIKKAQEAGAEVIVCTPIVRRTAVAEWGGNTLHGDYPQAIKTMLADLTADGKADGVTVVDMTTITKNIYDDMTPAETLYLHAWTNTKPGSVDSTHLNIYGAKVVARALLEAVQSANNTRLATHVVLGTAPTKENDLVSKPDYVEPEYAPPTTPSAQCQDYVAGDVHFKGTAMGYLGGTPSAANHVRETDANGNMHIAVKNNKGKIVGKTQENNGYDGIVMYYYQVPVGKTFSLSAKAKVNGVGTSAPSQAAFGLMARDDMYIDKNDPTLASDYVAAGTLGDSSANCFRRKDSELVKSSPLSTPVQVGESYDLKIVYNGDGYACTFGNEPTQSDGYDYQLTAVDSEYVYVGMFCARSFDVTFSNIVLTVDGQELCNTTTDVVPFDFTVTGWKFEDDKGAESETAVQGGKLASVTGVLDGDSAEALVFAAVYDLNGKMTGVKSLSVKNGEIPVGLAMNGGETAKIFAVKKDTLEPYGEAFEKTSGVPPKDPDAPEGRIKVWDFAGVDETDEETYENMVTLGALSDAGVPSSGSLAGTFDINGVTFQDTSGRLYSTVPDWITNGNNKYGQATFTDGYISQGGIYVGGTADATKRYLIIRDVEAGDKIVAYLGSTNGAITYYAGTLTGTDVKEAVKDFTADPIEGGKYERRDFIAKRSGDFKLWSKTGKGFFCRVKVLKSAEVKGTVTAPAAVTGYGLKFINQTTKEETAATLSGNSFTAKLAPGYTYTAVLTGVNGYGFTNATKQVAVTDAESVTGKAGVALAVEEKHQYTYSGKVTGFAQDYDITNLAVTLVPDADAAAGGTMDVELTLGADLSYSALLDPSVTYTVTLGGVNDYKVTAGGTVTSEGNPVTQGITVALKDKFAATGKFVTLDVDDQFAPLDPASTYAALTPTVSALTFTNVDDGYVYTATVENGGYSVNLRDGTYLATATVDGYATKTHVVVNGGAATKDLLFVSTATPDAVAYAAEVTVDPAGAGETTFKTVTGALAYIKRMGERTADQRVTVKIAPGVYREQINVDTPYVTFVNAAPNQGEVKLTWYYGIGYTYYSSDGGWYSPEAAFDKCAKPAANVARWGCTVRVTANGFRAEGITFENSFNYYMTDEEVVDGVALSGEEKITFARKYGAEVTSKAATERAAVIYVDGAGAAETEFKDCQFLSSQDTIITGGNMYFKNCLIEGMTDYICGPGNAIFDGCELRFKGYHKDYANAAIGGHITAPQTAEGGKGYLFRGCSVTASSNANMTVATGDFGRNWSAKAGAMFVNTKLQRADLISAAGWTDWNDKQLAKDANFREWGTTTVAGDPVATTGRVAGTVLTAAPTATVSDYFGGTPYYYVAESGTVAFANDPRIYSNRDVNAPTPGNTLTVGYSLGEANDANDVSKIQWFAVKDGKETLLKASTANVDKSYKLQSTDTGSYIKVTVTPATLSGAAAAAKSAETVAPVADGYDDPSDDRDPTLGDGVNIFLAGDSTVKDYTTSNDGKGSWGEYLQEYFDEETVTVVNYANGGRSTRNFINEGSLKKIQDAIGEGDYLFIQFGHNDCYEDDKLDRYVAVGTPGADGKYPTTPAQKYATPSALSQTLKDRYGAEMYTWDVNNDGTTPNGTFKWYLKQYIDVAKAAGATPVLITPVSRLNYNADGTIKNHHDDSTSSGNAYVTAMKQLGEEEGVQVIDGFELTKDMLEAAWKADPGAVDAKNAKPYGKQLLCGTDSTHYNKLGGMLTAAAIAAEVQKVDWNIAGTVHAPTGVTGAIKDGATVFTITNAGAFTAYDINDNYASRATYWETIGQAMFKAIADKAAELKAPVTPAP